MGTEIHGLEPTRKLRKLVPHENLAIHSVWKQINASLLTCARRTYSEIVDDVAGKSIIWEQINASLLTCDIGFY